MSAPFRPNLVDLTAPTPQNTPANAAPISSRAQPPRIESINEVASVNQSRLTSLASATIEEADSRSALASMIGGNPALVALMQAKLNGLIGRSSGYIESLPAEVQRRVAGLKGIQKSHAKLEAEFQEEVLELEKKYSKKFSPLYQQRAEIINGKAEPTDDQVAAGKVQAESTNGEETTPAVLEAPASASNSSEPTHGIPEFWLSSMKNNVSLAEMITEDDQIPLRHLTDIRMEYLDKPGFKLIFEFSENEFFENKAITKTYFYREESGYGGDFIYDHAEGDTIQWKSGKDLTVRVESKKQRNKNTKQTRIIKKTVPKDSFFNFFSPPKPPNEDVDADADTDIEERLELDYQLGEDIKEKLIPRAIDWFTGEALQYEAFDELDDEEGLEDEDDMDDDSEDRDDEDADESDEEGDGSKPKQEAECKQS